MHTIASYGGSQNPQINGASFRMRSCLPWSSLTLFPSADSYSTRGYAVGRLGIEQETKALLPTSTTSMHIIAEQLMVQDIEDGEHR